MLGPIMKTIEEAHPREFEEIFRLLKAADAVIEKSELFREFGKSGPGESSAEAQIYAKARSLVAKSPDINLANLIKIHLTHYQQQGIQSTLISPGLLLDQSWMNFSMEKTPVRSSTLRPRN